MKVRCPHCQKLLAISDSLAGQQVNCKACGRTMVAPPVDSGPALNPAFALEPEEQESPIRSSSRSGRSAGPEPWYFSLFGALLWIWLVLSLVTIILYTAGTVVEVNTSTVLSEGQALRASQRAIVLAVEVVALVLFIFSAGHIYLDMGRSLRLARPR